MRRYRHALGAKFRTPWTIRLEKEFADLQKLRDESTILEFRHQGDPPDKYQFRFKGKSLVPGGHGGVKVGDVQEVEIELGADYPRRRPVVKWLSPIAHPNISGGNVCFGNFASNWTPAVRLADIVEILWDYSRLAILNPHSAYGGVSEWPDLDQKYGFPIDKRPLRDKVLRNDAGSSQLRPSGGADDIVIVDGDSDDCIFIG